jgi:hypothetical protein
MLCFRSLVFLAARAESIGNRLHHRTDSARARRQYSSARAVLTRRATAEFAFELSRSARACGTDLLNLEKGAARRRAATSSRKLEDEPGMSGAWMPFGDRFLDQATVDTVKSWIQAGALNN